MMEEIFVGVLVVIAMVAGLWVFWFENMSGKTPDKEEKEKDKK